MAKVVAGEIVHFVINGKNVQAKVEDASKSESLLAKVVSSQSDDHAIDQVYEFDRNAVVKD